MGLHDAEAFEAVHAYLLAGASAERAATYADALVAWGAPSETVDEVEHLAFFAAAVMNSAVVTRQVPRQEPHQRDLALWQLIERIPLGYLTAMYERGMQPGPVTLELVCRLYHGGFPKEKLWGLAHRPMNWRVEDILALKHAPAEFFRDFGPYVKEMNSAEVQAVAESGIAVGMFEGPFDEGVSPFEIVRLAADLPADFMNAVS